MYGLESVAHVGQRARDDDAHRVIDERLFDLLVDETREDAFAITWAGHEVLREGNAEGFSVAEVYPKEKRIATCAAACKLLRRNGLRTHEPTAPRTGITSVL